MATIVSHPAVPIGISMAVGVRVVSGRLLLASAIASIVPDADAIGFWLGVPYGSVFGHRGFTHSIFFALVLGAAGAAFSDPLRASRKAAFWTVLASAASHGVFDAMTDGGLGITFLSPFSNERFFLPWRLIPVAPIAISGFRSFLPGLLRGELLPIWLPCLVFGAAGMLLRLARPRAEGRARRGGPRG